MALILVRSNGLAKTCTTVPGTKDREMGFSSIGEKLNFFLGIQSGDQNIELHLEFWSTKYGLLHEVPKGTLAHVCNGNRASIKGGPSFIELWRT